MRRVISTFLFVLVAVTCAAAQGGLSAERQCAPNSEAVSASAHLEVPAFIETGLLDGSMQRVGGVIRTADEQQTIAWLRKSGQVGQVAESSAGLLEQITRLSGTGHLALGQLLASVTPLLNISMAGFSLVEHITGIRAHEAELDRIYDRVAEEFQRDREVELLAALDDAETMLLMNSETLFQYAVVDLTSRLSVARRQLTWDLDELLATELDNGIADLAMQYQVLAMKVCAMSTRLFMEIGEEKSALDRLSKCVYEHEDYARQFVRKWLEGNSALYFHASVSDEYLERFLDIAGWLRGKRDVLSEIVWENREDFWNQDVLQPLYSTSDFGRRMLIYPPFYASSIFRAEALIENFRRLQGYEQELKSMCPPSFAHWEALTDEASALSEEGAGYVLLLDARRLPSG